MDKVNVSEFKAVCLRLLEQVRQTGQPIEILKNGQPLAIVHPPPAQGRKAAFGAMASSLRAPSSDLISPVAHDDWEVLEIKSKKATVRTR
jgi:antitoxin (DNA-binding transcriptional repressor) of toxin-antitoxin stability system